MRSIVEIANMALGQIGCKRIDSLTEASAEAQAVRLYLPQTMDACLATSHWTFNRTFVRPAAVAGQVYERYAGAFAVPPDCVAIRRIVVPGFDPRNSPYTFAFELVGDLVFTDVQDPILEYSRRIADPTRLPPLFVEFVVWSLAGKLLMPLTRSSKLINWTATMAKSAKSTAISSDASQETTRQDYEAEAIRVRERSTHDGWYDSWFPGAYGR